MEINQDNYYSFDIDTNQNGKYFAASLYEYLQRENFTYVEERGNVIEGYDCYSWKNQLTIELRKNFTPDDEFYNLMIDSIKNFCENYYDITRNTAELRVKKIKLNKVTLIKTIVSSTQEEIKSTTL